MAVKVWELKEWLLWFDWEEKNGEDDDQVRDEPYGHVEDLESSIFDGVGGYVLGYRCGRSERFATYRVIFSCPCRFQ